MAIHSELPNLATEVIEEYLAVAESCLATQKQSGGVYGYPAAILLFCIIEALGYYSFGGKEPFRVLKQPIFGCNLTDDEIKQLERWYRNPLAHNALLQPGVLITAEGDGIPFTSGEPVEIKLKPLFELVRAAWQALDKKHLAKPRTLSLFHRDAAPVSNAGATLSARIAASGAHITQRPQRTVRNK